MRHPRREPDIYVLSVLVDLSQASDDTAKQAIVHSRSPVIFSQGGARELFDHPRNVPDEMLRFLRTRGAKDGIV